MPKDERTKTQVTENSIVVEDKPTVADAGMALHRNEDQLRMMALDQAVQAHQAVPLPDHEHIANTAKAFYAFLKGESTNG